MKICAVTMVYRDYWALSQWYAHFARELGAENLFIVSHGCDPKISELCPDASVIVVPRDDLSGFDRVRGRMLNHLQDMLGFEYDWVIRTDADELVCVDPGRYRSLPDMLSRQEAPALFALGFNLVELDEDADLPADTAALSHRSTAVFTGHYSKAWAVRHRIALMRHGVQVKPKHVARFRFSMPRGVYLAHLKFADRAQLSEADARRKAASSGDSRGTPGTAWKDAEAESRLYLEAVAHMPVKNWPDAEQRAFDKIAQPVRSEKDGIIRARSVRMKHRTVLPQWFKETYGSDQ